MPATRHHGRAVSRQPRQSQRHDHGKARGDAQPVESRHEVVERRIDVPILDQLAAAVDLRPQRHRERKDRHEREHADRRREPAPCGRTCAWRDRGERDGQSGGENHHAIQARDFDPDALARDSERPPKQERDQHAARDEQRGREQASRQRRGQSMRVTPRVPPALADRERRQQHNRETRKKRTLGLWPRANEASPQGHAHVCRQVPVHVGREATGFPSDRALNPSRRSSRYGIRNGSRGDGDGRCGRQQMTPHLPVGPEPSPRHFPREKNAHRRREEQQVITARQVLRDPGQRAARKRRESPRLEVAVEAEPRKRHPHRGQHLEVRQRAEAVRRESVGHAGKECGASRAGQLADEQKHPERREHERGKERHVVDEDRVLRDRVDRKDHHRLRGEMFRVRKRERMRIVDVRVPVLAKRAQVTGRRAQQVLGVPRQDPAVEQRIAQVGGQFACEAADERPRQDEREERIGAGSHERVPSAPRSDAVRW